MRIHRLYHPDPLETGREVIIGGDDARYLIRVLRLAPGAPLVLFDGLGGEYAAELRSCRGRKEVTVQVGAHRPAERESALRVTLAQGISRGERMDHVVQKCTELGIDALVPLICERGVVRIDGRRAEARRQHWQRVAAEACRQCGRNRLPSIAPITALGDWLVAPMSDTRLALAPGADERLADLPAPGGSLTLLIGPEGGLAEHELAAARSNGFRSVQLGPRILRTETAAVAAVTSVQLLWGDL
ncbi:MAG: 16S rRNA (uracil(1498)-N(3))-methyltransferase [Gammaproteobacteria bacterium]